MVDPDADLPPFRVRHNDMKIETLKLIVRSTSLFNLEITELIKVEKQKPEGFMEKNVCMALVEHMINDKVNFGGGEGEWQCILGRNLAASLNYELHMLSFFDLPEFGYTVLIFKSG